MGVQVVERVEGAENTEALLDRLTSAMARFQEQLDRVHRQQREREEARRLREEQVRVASCTAHAWKLLVLLLRLLLSMLFLWLVQDGYFPSRETGKALTRYSSIGLVVRWC